MRLEPALLSYAGLACVALTTYRVRRDRAPDFLPAVATLHAFAAALLLGAAWRAVHHFGPYQGPVAFLGMLSIAALPLVLLLSHWPRAGLLGGIAAFTIALGGILSDIAG